MSEPVDQLSDLELMQRAKTTEPQRFGDLIRRYRIGLLRVAESRLRSRTLAEDVVQETFLAAFKSRHTFNPEFSFRTWLWTILYNQCKTTWNRKQRPFETMQELPVGDFEQAKDLHGNKQETPSPEGNLMAKERRELLDQLLATLPADQADALRLRFYGGLKFQEIADTMQCSLGTAKNRVRWGLAKLSKSVASSELNSNEPLANQTSHLNSLAIKTNWQNSLEF